MRVTPILALAAAAMVAGAASADQGLELLKSKQCLSCHAMTGSAVAPSFREIHHRFAGLKNARMMLTRVVIQGSDTAVFHWGPQKMPSEGARVPVTEEEAGAMVDYILALK